MDGVVGIEDTDVEWIRHVQSERGSDTCFVEQINCGAFLCFIVTSLKHFISFEAYVIETSKFS